MKLRVTEFHDDVLAQPADGERPRLTPTGFKYYFATDETSYHARGATFAICNGSARFIKNSMQSWTFFTGQADTYGNQIPDGTTYNASTIIWGGTPQLGICQAGGE